MVSPSARPGELAEPGCGPGAGVEAGEGGGDPVVPQLGDERERDDEGDDGFGDGAGAGPIGGVHVRPTPRSSPARSARLRNATAATSGTTPLPIVCSRSSRWASPSATRRTAG